MGAYTPSDNNSLCERRCGHAVKEGLMGEWIRETNDVTDCYYVAVTKDDVIARNILIINHMLS